AISGTNLNSDTMTGDGSDTTLTLSLAPVNENNTQVYIDGTYQHKDTYSISGTTLTFSTAPPLGTAVEVMTMNQLDINTPTDGSVTSAKLSGDLTTPGALTVTGTATMDGLTVNTGSYGAVGAGSGRMYGSTTHGLVIQGNGTTNDFLFLGSDGSELLTIDSSGNVGIGASSPDTTLHLQTPSGTKSEINFAQTAVTNYRIGVPASTDALVFTYGASTERMRIDSSGNVGIGSSPVSWSNGMRALELKGYSGTTKQGSIAFDSHSGANGYNLISTDTGNMVFYNGTTNRASAVETMRLDSSGNVAIGGVGVVAPSGIRFVVYGSGSGGAGLYFGSGILAPTNNAGGLSDNTVDLGTASYRFNDAFVTNGVTAGSDGNLKQDIEALSDAEQRVAVACKGLLRKFRWIDAVEAKGDDARIHFGIIAQDLQAAFEAEGLDAGRYAMFMSNTWWETQTEVAAVEAVEATEDTEAIEAVDAYTRTDTYDTAEEAPEGATERTRLGIRYSELLAFIIAAI
ncbi:tail fiber domain-containing protein, partial [bacterium]|nr:tail fiber domain-containing protein [bacterium]